MGKTLSYFMSNGSVKKRLKEKEPSISMTHTSDFERYVDKVN